MRIRNLTGLCLVFFALVLLVVHPAQAQEIVKIGLTAPLSGGGAAFGEAAEFMIKQAAQEIKEAGGVEVKGKKYNFECIAYDNKYNAAEGTKVAQTLINRDGVKFIGAIGTAPALAAQSLAERHSVILFQATWGKKIKGPEHPMTFSLENTPSEIYPLLIKYITETYPQAKTIALLNPNDASGRETEEVCHPLWEKAGIKVLTSDYYERGSTEFQPIANRLASFKPDIIDLAATMSADTGLVFKHLDVLGWKGVKVFGGGIALQGIVETGGPAVNGLYMAAAYTVDNPTATDHQRKISAELNESLGLSLGIVNIAFYDMVFMLKAGIEKAQSIDPKDVAAVLPSVKYRTFYGGEVGFGGKDVYGSAQQPMLPVHITQVKGGELVMLKVIYPEGN